jgi:L-2,4-diaminobutyric acid acetyltransferase
MVDQSTEIRLNEPAPGDGLSVSRLVSACPPLDANSVYCNLLQCDHFRATSLCAKSGSALVGFVSGYRIPLRPHHYFVWQVAVAPAARGQGLARQMIREVLRRPGCVGVTHLETTITASNEASWSMFHALARELRAKTESVVVYDQESHFGGLHESEQRLVIGPFEAPPNHLTSTDNGSIK